MSIIKTLQQLKSAHKISPPEWLIGNTVFLCQMGSVAYGVAGDASDVDVYGFCIPTKEILFPHHNGSVYGFDRPQAFGQWQQHHVQAPPVEYDFSVYGIVKYFSLVRDNNPNMIDSLFVPRRCILHSTQVSEYIRENRSVFLHRGAWHKFKGYAYSQVSKMKGKYKDVLEELLEYERLFNIPKNLSTTEINDALLSRKRKGDDGPEHLLHVKSRTLSKYKGMLENLTKRQANAHKHGYETKFAYHVVRLLNEVEQILTEGTLDLQRNKEQLKSIRRGEWSKEQILNYFEEKELMLEKEYLKSDLPKYPRNDEIRAILITAIEMWYEDVREMYPEPKTSKAEQTLKQIQQLLNGV